MANRLSTSDIEPLKTRLRAFLRNNFFKAPAENASDEEKASTKCILAAAEYIAGYNANRLLYDVSKVPQKEAKELEQERLRLATYIAWLDAENEYSSFISDKRIGAAAEACDMAMERGEGEAGVLRRGTQAILMMILNAQMEADLKSLGDTPEAKILKSALEESRYGFPIPGAENETPDKRKAREERREDLEKFKKFSADIFKDKVKKELLHPSLPSFSERGAGI